MYAGRKFLQRLLGSFVGGGLYKFFYLLSDGRARGVWVVPATTRIGGLRRLATGLHDTSCYVEFVLLHDEEMSTTGGILKRPYRQQMIRGGDIDLSVDTRAAVFVGA